MEVLVLLGIGWIVIFFLYKIFKKKDTYRSSGNTTSSASRFNDSESCNHDWGAPRESPKHLCPNWVPVCLIKRCKKCGERRGAW